MPRVANSGDNVDEWYEEVGEGTSTWDVCRECWRENERLGPRDWERPDGKPIRSDAFQTYNGDPVGTSTAPTRSEPCYESGNGFHNHSLGLYDPPYTCECCNKTLRSEDHDE